MNTVLPRLKTPDVSPELATSRIELAVKAQALFGKRLSIAPDSLFSKLAALGISPLQPDAVNKYKTRKARPGMWSGTRNAIIYACIIVVVMSIALFLVAPHAIMTPYGPNMWQCVFVASWIVSAVLTFTAFTSIWGPWQGERITRHWVLNTLAEYKGLVPEFVLRKAVQIKEAIPAAYVNVEYLQVVYERQVRPDPDPFLVVSMDDERYYIDVWDERDFERTL